MIVFSLKMSSSALKCGCPLAGITLFFSFSLLIFTLIFLDIAFVLDRTALVFLLESGSVYILRHGFFEFLDEGHFDILHSGFIFYFLVKLRNLFSVFFRGLRRLASGIFLIVIVSDAETVENSIKVGIHQDIRKYLLVSVKPGNVGV